MYWSLLLFGYSQRWGMYGGYCTSLDVICLYCWLHTSKTVIWWWRRIEAHICRCLSFWPSGKLPFECQKIAPNLTFFFNCQKKNYWQKLSFLKKCQVIGNFLTFKWQFSGGSGINMCILLKTTLTRLVGSGLVSLTNLTLLTTFCFIHCCHVLDDLYCVMVYLICMVQIYQN